MIKKKLIVIGGGAAGFFCAINAAEFCKNLEVIIIEKSSKLLSKVKISGGGRCNVTNSCESISTMASCYPRGEKFLKKAFHQFFTTDTINWFKERGVKLKAEPDGRMFPTTDNSETIINCLLNEASKNKVNVITNKQVTVIHKRESNFILSFADGIEMACDYLCIAAGGFPKKEQFNWLSNMGHTIVNPVPSLFTFNIPKSSLTPLMGIALNATVKIAKTNLSQTGPLLITHWGISGPAVLKLSSQGARILAEKNYNFEIFINWLPDFNDNTLRKYVHELRVKLGSQKIINRNPFAIPSRLWEHFISEAGIKSEARWAEIPAKEQNLLVKILTSDKYIVSGKTTFKEEFVTAGGITLDEVNHNTMESKITEGLFFAGEILDVDGITGGFNFQNAWTTGFIAAKSISQSIK
ncbi:MAG: NAD(P)/FAD-dependent oxidoreductase [Ferruginibacter sp.]